MAFLKILTYKEAFYYDVYKITQLSDKEMDYIALKTAKKYSIQKVDEDFKL